MGAQRQGRSVIRMRNFLIWVILLTLLGGVLRFAALGDLPPGLWRDEAYYALDAVQVLEGERPIFFEANNGREPLFIYLVAGSIAALGHTPVAVRLVAAILGTLLIPATALMGRALFSDRVGLLAAAVTAISVWSLNLSRVGFRTVTLPLILALCVWQAAVAVRTGRLGHFVAAGALYGLLFYTYLGARFTPIALLAALAVWWLGQTREARAAFPWRGAAVAGVTALVVAAPLFAYLALHPGEGEGRGVQVSILNPVINEGDPVGLLLRQAVATAAMFTFRGDFNPRHNVPLRPVFDPLIALAAVLGLGIALAHWRRASDAFILAWTGVMLLPTVLAEDAPHFLRAVGVLPIAFLFPALGLDGAWSWLAARGRATLGAGVVMGALALGLGLTVRDYFVVHARSEAAYYQFETGATELAREINTFLGTGWQGGWREVASDKREGYRAYLDTRLWEGWPSLRFLIHPAGVRTLTPGRAVTGDAIILALWPQENHDALLAELPQDSLIEVREGAWERGDLDPEARQLYYSVRVTPDKPPETLGADLGVARLRAAEWHPTSDGVRVRLVWDAKGPLSPDTSAFVHVAGPRGLVGQSDGTPGAFYPARLWRVGDTVAEERDIVLPPGAAVDEVRVGLYDRTTQQRQRLASGEDYAVVPRGSAP